MSYNIYVKNEQGNSIVTFGERLSALKNLTDEVLIFHVWDMS